jgi:hypothetical protein
MGNRSMIAASTNQVDSRKPMGRFKYLILLGLAAAFCKAEVPRIRVVAPGISSQFCRDAVAAFTARVEQRCPAKVVTSGSAPLTIRLRIQPGIGKEGYIIRDAKRNQIEIVGNDERGLLYGLGKLLHTSAYSSSGFAPGSWRGRSVPASQVRGVYLACHFGNYYEAAPLDELQTYVEDLAFWGINSVVLSFPPWQYDSFDDPAARKNIERIRLVMKRAKRAGLRVGLMQAENQVFRSAPRDIRNEPYPDDWGRRGNLGTNVCPSKPAGRAYLMAFWNRLLDEFRDPGLDYVAFWPYDEGGCGCKECWPWGAKGHPNLSRAVTELARRRWPDCKFILSTWMYDSPPAGEWKGLSRLLAEDPRLTDYIMADAHEDFPRYPLENGVPGGKPLLNFPEISMWGMSPWGGYGANPLPARFQSLWNQVSGAIAGGFPYSEGIYEDINKVICSQFYWSPSQSARATVTTYAAAYFSPDVAETVTEAVDILEKNHKRSGRARFSGAPASARRAFELMTAADARLTPQARQSWRWRILYLRALIDDSLSRTNGRFRGAELRQAFDELVRIYHAQNVHTNKVAPPAMEDGQ